VLARAAFYPEGGGQPYDTGVLGGVEVSEVHEKAGVVTHNCAAPLPVGETVQSIPIRAAQSVERLTFGTMLRRMLSAAFFAG